MFNGCSPKHTGYLLPRCLVQLQTPISTVLSNSLPSSTPLNYVIQFPPSMLNAILNTSSIHCTIFHKCYVKFSADLILNRWDKHFILKQLQMYIAVVECTFYSLQMLAHKWLELKAEFSKDFLCKLPSPSFSLYI